MRNKKRFDRIKNLGKYAEKGNNLSWNQRADVYNKSKEIIKMYSSELISTEDISKILNCSESIIYKILKKNNAIMNLSERLKLLNKAGKIIVWNKNKNHPKYKEYIELVTESGKLNKGKISCRKGLSMEEEYGIERANEINEQNRINHIGKKATIETRKLMSEKSKGIPKSEDHRKKISMGHIKLWSTPEFVEKRLKKLLERPTGYENKISDLCIKNNLPFIYTGNGAFIIGHKNPDFVNEKDKIVIEVYYSYFKIRGYGSCENYEKLRREYFAKYGYKTIFIRDNEINSENWGEICLNKIKGNL